MGIFRKNQKVFCGDKNLFDIVKTKAALLKSNFYCLGFDFNFSKKNNLLWDFEASIGQRKIKYRDLPIPSVPIENIALCLAVLELEFFFPNFRIKDYISNFKMLGRMSVLKKQDTGLPLDILFDGAHNAHASINLANSLSKNTNFIYASRLHIVFHCLFDKNIYNILKSVCDLLINFNKKDVIWYLPQLNNRRSSSFNVLKKNILSCYTDEIKPSIVLIEDIYNLKNLIETNIVNQNDFAISFGTFNLLGFLLGDKR